MDFVLVHGAWCGGWIWQDVEKRLRAQGHRTHVVEQLPGSARDRAEPADPAADAEHVRAVLDGCTGESVLVGHSYGGMVITEVADHPRLAHSVYVAAFWPRAGQALVNLSSAHEVEWSVGHADGTLRITDDAAVAHQVLGADLDPDLFADIHRRWCPQSAASFTSASTAPPRTSPTTYVICESDQGVRPVDQETMAAQADTVHRLDASHLVPLSQPAQLADLLHAIGS